jgi:hypothetical protein
MIKDKLKQIYRLFRFKNRSNIVWADMKQYFFESMFKYANHEKEKSIEAFFNLDKDHVASFFYTILENDDLVNINVRIIDKYHPEHLTEIVFLANHFNMLFKKGLVTIRMEESAVYFVYQVDLLACLIDQSKFINEISNHYSISIDLYWSFNRLIETGEDPVFIIADLKRKIREEKNKAKED